MSHAALSVSSSTGKLNSEAFSHKIGSILIQIVSGATERERQEGGCSADDIRKAISSVAKREWLAMVDRAAGFW